MDFPAAEGPIRMDCVTSTDTEPCFLIESSYTDCHSKEVRNRELCTVNKKCCLQIVVNKNLVAKYHTGMYGAITQ